MAFGVSTLRSGDLTAPGTSWATPSATPGAASRLTFLVLNVFAGSFITTPVSPPSGMGVTWVLVQRTDYQTFSFESEACFVYRALGAGAVAGAVSWTSPETWQEVVYGIVEISGIDPSGSNGSGAIAQVKEGHTDGSSANTETITFATPTNAANLAIAFIVSTQAVSNVTPTGSGSPIETFDSPTAGMILEAHYVVGSSVSAMSASWSANAARGGVAIEVKTAPTTTPYAQAAILL